MAARRASAEGCQVQMTSSAEGRQPASLATHPRNVLDTELILGPTWDGVVCLLTTCKLLLRLLSHSIWNHFFRIQGSNFPGDYLIHQAQPETFSASFQTPATLSGSCPPHFHFAFCRGKREDGNSLVKARKCQAVPGTSIQFEEWDNPIGYHAISLDVEDPADGG